MTHTRTTRLSLVAVMLMLSLSVAGCGKKGDLEPPSGISPTYPRTYPAPLPVPQTDPSAP